MSWCGRCARLGAPLLVTMLACSAGPSTDTRERVTDYLLPDPYPRLVLEVDFVGGHALDLGVVEPLLLVVQGLVDKPDGVDVVYDTSISSHAGRTWTFAALDALAQDSFDLEVAPDEAKIHVMLLDGRYHDSDGEELLGLAWGHRHVALFRVAVQEACASGRGGRGLSARAFQSG